MWICPESTARCSCTKGSVVKWVWKIYYIVHVRIPKALKSPSVSLSVIRTFPPPIPTQCPLTIYQIWVPQTYTRKCEPGSLTNMTAKGQRWGEAICFCTKKGSVCLSGGGPAGCSPPILPPGLHRITPCPRTQALAVGCQSQLLNFQKFISSLKLAMAEVFAL